MLYIRKLQVLERNLKIHGLLSKELTEEIVSMKGLQMHAPELHVGVAVNLAPTICSPHILAY